MEDIKKKYRECDVLIIDDIQFIGGKAATDYWVMVVRPGRILFEVAGVPPQEAIEALRLASHKLSIPTKTVRRDQMAALAGGAG